jgi:hypothetical protein
MPSQSSGPCSTDVFFVRLADTLAAFNASLVLAPSNLPYSPPKPDTLRANDTLSAGNYLLDARGKFTASMQAQDGNFVLYSPNQPLWASRTAVNPNAWAIMQGDGNFVINRQGCYCPIWSTNTQNNPGAYLIVQGDGNMVIYSSTGSPLWYTGTGH